MTIIEIIIMLHYYATFSIKAVAHQAKGLIRIELWLGKYYILLYTNNKNKAWFLEYIGQEVYNSSYIKVVTETKSKESRNRNRQEDLKNIFIKFITI